LVSINLLYIFLFSKGRGYSREKCNILSNSSMQTVIVSIHLHAAIGQYFAICNDALDILLKWFSCVREYPLERVFVRSLLAACNTGVRALI
jgi:hypothetical protein